MMQMAPVKLLEQIFQQTVRIAVVGLSQKTNRPSHIVALYMQQAGYEIIPVNPGLDEILGEKCYPDLQSIPVSVDVVNIFRRSDQVRPFVEDAIAIKAKVVWMQEGIVNEEAAEMAEQAGLTVIMDRCIKIDHAQYALEKPRFQTLSQ